MSAKGFPPYHIEGEGIDSWIEDRSGALVISAIKLSYHYAAVFEDMKLMQILCNAMNDHAEGGDQ